MAAGWVIARMAGHEAQNTYRLTSSLTVLPRQRHLWLSWQDHQTGERLSGVAGPHECLALEIVTRGLSIPHAARERGMPPARLYRLLSVLDRRGVLEAPSTLLRRDPAVFPSTLPDDRLTVATFGLQWHITNACDLHCRHCYDRSRRAATTEALSARILDELERFCQRHLVAGSISFTGGNPFLHPEFLDMYAEAVRRGFDVAVLGNPVPRGQLEALCRIRVPELYQVSLEGRRAQNDGIRGVGTYDRVVRFLRTLDDLGVPSCVMLTATEANLEEILPLAATLRRRTPGFAFNRLAPVGEGAALDQPPPGAYRRFLQRYVDSAAENDILGFKENLINLHLWETGRGLAAGCTGFGCGAAFDFVAVLPDGEVHACRKFPSRIGDIQQQSLEEIYFSPAAARYRRGMAACDGCPIRHACGGCMATAVSGGSDPASARDAACWRL